MLAVLLFPIWICAMLGCVILYSKYLTVPDITIKQIYIYSCLLIITFCYSLIGMMLITGKLAI